MRNAERVLLTIVGRLAESLYGQRPSTYYNDIVHTEETR